jgi:hypothetical protein
VPPPVAECSGMVIFVPMATSKIDTRHLDLRIVPAHDVLLHELTDPERVRRLEQYLRDDNVLRNPPVVAEVQTPDGMRYVVLDGATRTTALRNAGCRDILVQVVPYGDDAEVTLEAWYHLLRHHAMDAVLDAMQRMEGAVVTTTNLEQAHAMLADRTAAAAIALTENDVRCIGTTDPSHDRGPIIRSLVQHYGGFGEIYRIVNRDLLETIRSADDVPAVVIFPTWSPADLTRAALAGDLLPAGITRHVIPGRALNVNLSLDVLTFEAPCGEKNAWLQSWLTAKIMAKKVRYYHEPVFVFDD